MALTRVWELGLGANSEVPSADLTQLDINASHAVDGTDGGEYDADITFNDAHLEGTSDVDTSGNIVTSGLVQGGSGHFTGTLYGEIVQAAGFFRRVNDILGTVTAATATLNIPPRTDGQFIEINASNSTPKVITLDFDNTDFSKGEDFYVRLSVTSSSNAKIELVWGGSGVTHVHGPYGQDQPMLGDGDTGWHGAAIDLDTIHWSVVHRS